MSSSNNYISDNKIIVPVLLILGIGLVGCMDQFLDTEPKDSITPKNFYESPEDAEAAVYGVYEQLATPDLYNFNGVMFILASASDQARPFGAKAERVAINEYTNTAINGITSNWWRAWYKLINRANAVTDNVPDIDMNPEDRASLVGEAKFLRALAYFNLVRMFGKVPILTTATDNFKKLDKPRAPIDSVYAQILEDLKFAEQNLPESYSGEDSGLAESKGRATKGAAKTLLAKVYLTRKKWQKAASKAKEVINSGNYALFKDYAHIFLPKYENGKGHIFSIQFHAGDQNAGKQGRFWTYTAPNERKTGSSIAQGGSSYGAVFAEKDYYKAYPNDYRKEVNFFTEWTFEKSGKTVTFDPHFYKYHDPTQVNAKRSSVNFPLFRYAEVLLIYAEALNEIHGPTSQAYWAINQVRKRARFGKPDSVLPDLSGLNQTEFRKAVYRERNWEFAGEGKRWFDLKRTGRLLEVMREDGKDIGEENLLFPISSLELQLNPEWEQNPGY